MSALGMMAPLVSLTLPVKAPVISCACPITTRDTIAARLTTIVWMFLCVIFDFLGTHARRIRSNSLRMTLRISRLVNQLSRQAAGLRHRFKHPEDRYRPHNLVWQDS